VTKTTIIDGWLDAQQIAALSAAWPTEGWFHYNDHDQRKSTLSNPKLIPPVCRKVLTTMALEFRGSSVPDFSLWGAGLCDMRPGDYLGEHLDHDVHPNIGLRRTHNAILFLGGDGDLIVGRGKQEVVVNPVPGRLCLFDTTEDSWHRVEKVTELRRSLSIYFYDPKEWKDPAASNRTRAAFNSRDPLDSASKQLA
jgi:hypothetical protein